MAKKTAHGSTSGESENKQVSVDGNILQPMGFSAHDSTAVQDFLDDFSHPNANEVVTEEREVEDLFDREEVMKFINDAGLLSYNVRAVRINNYLISLFKMAHLLTMSGLHRMAIREVQSEMADMIHGYVEELKVRGEYDALVL